MKSTPSPRFSLANKRLILLTLVSLVAVASLLSFAVSANRANRAAKARAELAKTKSAINPVQNDKQPLAPNAAVITATLTDNVTAATKVVPGGTINYTAVITNGGAVSPGDDATSVQYAAALDSNTSFVAGSAHASPIATANAYTTVGNTLLEAGVAASGNPSVISAVKLFDNDTIATSPDTIVLVSNTQGPNGATVSVNADGSFTYLPAAGFTGTDTFTYTIRNSADATLTDTGTVTVTVGAPRVWYVNNSAAAGGSGRSTSPFNTLAGAAAVDAAGDIIYIFTGGGNYTGGITLLNNEQVIGNGVALVVNTFTLRAAGSRPTVVNGAGNGFTLASANTLTGFNFGNCTGGFAFQGGGVGALAVNNVLINTNGGAMDITAALSSVNIVLDSTTSSGSAQNVRLVTTNGTVTLGSGALSGATANAFDVSGGTAAITYTGTISNSGGKQVSVASKTGGSASFSGAISGTGTGINLTTNTGATIGFSGGMTLSTSTNPAFTATGGGTVNVSGTNNITTTSGAGINWNGDTSGSTVTFNNVTSTTGGAVSITSSGATDFTFNDVTSTTGTAVAVTTATGDFIFHAINANGAVKGIALNGATGTFTVNGTSTTDGTGGTIQNCTAKGAEFISSNNITLKNINFTNNGTSQTVAGSAATCGGNLLTGNNLSCVSQIHLQTVSTVSLDNLNITSGDQMGINGNAVSAFTLANSSVTGNGTEDAENGLTFQNLTGTCSISDTLIQDNFDGQVVVANIANSSTLTLGVTGTRTNNVYPIQDTSTTMIGRTAVVAAAEAGILFNTLNTSTSVNMTLNLTGVVLNNNYPANAVFLNMNSASGALGGTTTNCSFDRNGGGLIIQAQNGQGGTYNVTNSEFYQSDLQSILYSALNPFNSTMIGTVQGNTIGSAGNAGSACTPGGSNCTGIDANFIGGSGSLQLKIGGTVAGQGNTVQQFDGNGIRVVANGSSSPSVQVAIQNNTIQNPFNLVAHGIDTNIGTTAGANVIGCLNITGNTITGTYQDPGVGQLALHTRVRFLSEHRLPGMSGTGAANAEAFLNTNNPGVGGLARIFSEGNGVPGYQSGAACTTPPIPNPADDSVSNRMENGLDRAYTNAVPQAKTESAKAPVTATPVSSKDGTASVTAKATPKASAAEVARIHRNDVLSHHAVRTNFNSSPSQNAPNANLPVAVGTLPAGKSVTIKYSATVNTTVLTARQATTQGTITANGGAISVTTTDPGPPVVAGATVTLLDTTLTWTGATDTNWNTATNWNQPGPVVSSYAPGVSNPAVNDVVIPNVGAQPNISATDIGIYSLNISNGRTLTIDSPRVLAIGGSPGGDLNLDGIISGGNMNLGTGTHVINNAGGTGSLSSTNLMTVLSGSTTTLNNNLQAGALAVNAGGSLNLTNRTLSLNGSGAAFTSGGTITTTGSTFVFNGTAAQQVAGIVYNNLTINNSLGLNVTGVTLTGNATLAGALALTSSDLDTGAFSLTQLNTTPSTGVSDVVGMVIRSPGGAFALATPVTFGNPNNIITFTAGATRPTALTVVMAKTAPASFPNAVQRNYTITPTGGSGYTATLRLHYLDSELGTNIPETSLNLRRFNGTGWAPVIPTAADTTNNWLENNAVTTFSQWTFSTFTPTASGGVVTGRIVDSNGAPVEGAVVRLEGTQNRKFITDANGVYRFDNVETGGFYTVTPSRANYSFTPSVRSFSQLGETTNAAFGATLLSSGFINPLDTPEYFVRQHYVDFLGREPDEAGFNFWSDQIIECGTDQNCIERRRENVSAAYFLSIEFQKTGGLVDGLYRASYGVRPDFAHFLPDTRTVGLGVQVNKEGWEALLAANTEAFVNSFVNRTEFHQLYDSMDNSQYVDTLISHTGVSFTSAERDALVGGLGSGSMTRAQALRSIAENGRFVQAKFNETFVMMEYFGYLRRDADASGFAFWLNKLNEFNGNFEQAEMVKAFIVSGEYRDRFPR